MRKYTLILMTLLLTAWSHGQDSISVLFIGNSYTSVNDLPSMTQQLTQSLGKQLTIGSKLNGGYTFNNHSTDPQSYAAMHQQNWDVVVLQGQSQEPSFDDTQVDTQTIPFAKQLADSVYAINPCSNVLFYMTWGRENGDPQWAPISTFAGMNGRLYNAYLRMADSTDAMVSAVGAVWKYVRDNHPTIQLYAGDGSHPSVGGSYLAACTFYTSLFQSPSIGATYTAGLDAQTVQQLQSAADFVILDSIDHFKLHPINQPVQASFITDQNLGEVQFTSTSTRATTFSWDFDDGFTASDENPLHVYGAIGNYNVQLIASNSCASDTTNLLVDISTLIVDELTSDEFELIEYNDHFVVNAFAKPIYYEIYTFDGKIINKDEILTGESAEISKVVNGGIIVLKNRQMQLFIRSFVNRTY